MKITITKEEVLKALKLPSGCEIEIVEAVDEVDDWEYRDGFQNGYYDYNKNIISVHRPKNFTGTMKKFYSNGAEGPKGQLMISIQYKNGKKHGQSLRWHDNLQLRSEDHYKNDELNGQCLTYNADGDVTLTEQWVNGTIVNRAGDNWPDNANIRDETFKLDEQKEIEYDMHSWLE
jgi:antitoxin component YwqK of YwqJK toxin-antitoxin module